MRGEWHDNHYDYPTDEVAAQIEAQHISQQQLDAFVVTAVKAWLNRSQVSQEAQNIVQSARGLKRFKTVQ